MSNANGEIDATELLDQSSGQSDDEKIFNEAWNSITAGEAFNKDAPSEEVTPEVETSEDPADKQPEQPAPQDTASQWMESLPEEAREHIQALLTERDSLQQNYRSVHNRLAPTQRKVTELQRRIQELQATPQTQSTPSVDVSKKEDKPTSELWAKVKESDPVLADAIEEMLASERNRMQQEFDSRLQPVHERTREDDLARETQTLLSIVPNAVEIFTSPLYADWLTYQPESIQKLHESPRHQDALALMRLFDADIARYEMQNGNQQQQASAQPSNPEADKVAQRRQEKLSKPVPQQNRPAAALPKEESEEDVFNKAYNEAIKQAYPQYGLKLRS